MARRPTINTGNSTIHAGNVGAIQTPKPTPDEVDLLKRIDLFSREDKRALQQAWRILADQTDDCLDRLMGLLAAHHELCHAYEPGVAETGLADILTIRRRFHHWLRMTCKDPAGLAWPDYFFCTTANGQGLPFRYVVALITPLLTIANSLLADKARSREELESMTQALMKSLLLQVALLSRHYVRENLW